MEYYGQLTDVDYVDRKSALHAPRDKMFSHVPLEQMTVTLWYQVYAEYERRDDQFRAQAPAFRPG